MRLGNVKIENFAFIFLLRSAFTIFIPRKKTSGSTLAGRGGNRE